VADPHQTAVRQTAARAWLWRVLAAGGLLLLATWAALKLAGQSAPAWGFIPGLLVLAAALWVRPRYRLPTDVCPWCGYDTLALDLPGSACPECGAPIPARESGELATHVRHVREKIPR
jgi:hypothetical protein